MQEAWIGLLNTAMIGNLSSLEHTYKGENSKLINDYNLSPLVSLCTKINTQTCTHTHTHTHTHTNKNLHFICFTLAHIKSDSHSQSGSWLMPISCHSWPWAQRGRVKLNQKLQTEHTSVLQRFLLLSTAIT